MEWNPKDEVIKTTIIEAILKELKTVSVESIKSELSKMTVISPEIRDWAISQADIEYKQMLTANVIDDETVLKHCTPVELDKDDLYHASICSTVINQSCDREQCKTLFQRLSRRSLKKIAVTQPCGRLPFPSCMVVVCSNSSESTETTCYIAFKDFHFRELANYVQKSTLGKGNIILSKWLQ